MKVKIELTASPVLLDALLAIAQAFGGRAVTSTLEAKEAPQKRTKIKALAVEPVVETVAPPVEVVEPVAPPAEPVAPPVETPVIEAPVVKKEEPSNITVEDLRAIVRDKAQAGKREPLKALLAEFDATSVTTLKEEQYSAFKAKAEAL